MCYNNGIMSMGRPTKLTRELIDKAQDYLNSCTDTIRETEKGSLSYVEVRLPTIAGLALHLGIGRRTVYEWIAPKETEDEEEKQLRLDFSHTVDEILTEQDDRLVNGSLGGLYNAKIAGILMSNHGHIEKKSVDVTTKGKSLNLQSYTDEELERLADGSEEGASETGAGEA